MSLQGRIDLYRPVLRTTVFRADRATGARQEKTYYVRPAARNEVAAVVKLYNAVCHPDFETGLKIEARQIEARLDRDPWSVLVGYFEHEEYLGPVSLINNIKGRISGLGDVPTSHQALTGDDTWETSVGQGWNTLYCPWIASDLERGRGWSADYAGKKRSIGQLQVMAVPAAAEAYGYTYDGLIAYSRPGRLREYMKSHLSLALRFPGPGRTAIGRGELFRDTLGPYSLVGDRVGEERVSRPFTLEQYWTVKIGDTGRPFDAIPILHGENGARFEPALVFPNGHLGDRNSLFYRTGWVYKADFS